MSSRSAPAKKPEDTPIRKAMRRRRQRAADNRGWCSLAGRVLVIALGAWVVFGHIFLLARAEGNEMFPAVKDGDLLIANRLASDYEKDDVVIYTQNGETKVGRIVAVGGDVVTLDDGGSLIVNGTVQSGDIVYQTYALEGLEYPYSVPEGTVFILGDYRTNAEDSRTFGPVAEENILGRVMTLLRRRGL